MYFVRRGRISFAFRLITEVNIQIYFAVSTSRNSCPEVFCKKGVLRNIAKLTGKHLYQSLFFNKVAGLSAATLLKKRLWHKCFPVNFAQFLETSFFIEYLWWLLLNQAWRIFHLLFNDTPILL